MNENIKEILKLIEEHPDLPVVPMVGQGIVADCTGEWVAHFGKAEIRKICIYEDAVIFYDENPLKIAEALGFYNNFLPRESLDSLDWLEAIIVHIETPTIEIPDNTEKINELYEAQL